MSNVSGKGGLFQASDEAEKWAAWNNATDYPSLGLESLKIDCDGRIIAWSEYGQYTERGWHIDHATPSALGGSDEFHNLRARHWRGNTSAGGLLSGILSRNVRR